MESFPTPSHGPTRDRPLLFHRDFALIWWSQFISQVGDGVTKLALLWFVYAITGSPLKTTAIGILQTLPPIVFGPFLGILVDRLPKKFLLIGTDLVRAVIIGLIPCLVSAETFTVNYLYLLVFLNAMATAIFGPALFAAVPSVVARKELTAADALLQSTMSLGVIIGPALSGIGIATLSSQEVLCLNAATYIGSAGCLLFVRLPRKSRSPSGWGQWTSATWQDLAEGIRFAFVSQRMIFLLIITAGLYSFGISAFTTLLPVFGKNLLGLGPVEVGYLTSALGIGLLLSSMSLVWVTEWELWKRIRLLGLSSMIAGLALWGLGHADGFLIGAILVGLIGAGSGVLTPIEWAVVQEITPPHLIGRVLALYGACAMCAAISGMTTLGWLTEAFGESISLLATGLVLFLTALVAMKFSYWVRVQKPQLVVRFSGGIEQAEV